MASMPATPHAPESSPVPSVRKAEPARRVRTVDDAAWDKALAETTETHRELIKKLG